MGVYYAYFAAYGNTGYDPNDINFGDDGDLASRHLLPHRVADGPGQRQHGLLALPEPVHVEPAHARRPARGTFNPNQPASYINVNSFQIISAGGDGLWGPGGQWTSSGDRLPIPPFPPYGDETAVRPRENDNITNFTSGRLN